MRAKALARLLSLSLSGRRDVTSEQRSVAQAVAARKRTKRTVGEVGDDGRRAGAGARVLVIIRQTVVQDVALHRAVSYVIRALLRVRACALWHKWFLRPVETWFYGAFD
jgi:hypothetical protein